MKIWPLNSLYFVIFLVIGFLATAPFVLGLISVLWWLALPTLVAWTAVVWIWGVPLASSPGEAKAATIIERAVFTLIILGQSLVGVVLAIFLIQFLIHQIIALVLSLLIVGVCVFWFGREPPKRQAAAAPVRQPAYAGDGSTADVSEPGPATPQAWLAHHVSLLVFLGLGALTVADGLQRHSFALGWPAAGMTLAYAAFVWIHVVSPTKPGAAPPSFFDKVLGTFLTVVMTIVALAVLAVAAEAIGQLWVWIVPPVALFGLVVALNWRNPPPKRAA